MPAKIDLNDLPLFVAVTEAGGFTAAARRLGVATAKVSVEIARLEEALGFTLFNRTTRKVVPTAAGQALYEECRPLLQGLSEALERADPGHDSVGGTLRISTTVDHASLALAPALAEFARRHPALHVDLRTNDRVVDLIDEGVDLSIRLGWLRDSSMRAAKLGEFEQVLVAAPAYLARAGRPQAPDELARHEWVALGLLPTPLTWQFRDAAGEARTVHLRARLRVDSPGALRALLESGAGLSVLDGFNAAEGIRSGRLEPLLPGWTLPRGGIHAVFPPKEIPARVRSFVDFYRAWLAAAGSLSPGP